MAASAGGVALAVLVGLDEARKTSIQAPSRCSVTSARFSRRAQSGTAQRSSRSESPRIAVGGRVALRVGPSNHRLDLLGPEAVISNSGIRRDEVVITSSELVTSQLLHDVTSGLHGGRRRVRQHLSPMDAGRIFEGPGHRLRSGSSHSDQDLGELANRDSEDIGISPQQREGRIGTSGRSSAGVELPTAHHRSRRRATTARDGPTRHVAGPGRPPRFVSIPSKEVPSRLPHSHHRSIAVPTTGASREQVVATIGRRP